MKAKQIKKKMEEMHALEDKKLGIRNYDFELHTSGLGLSSMDECLSCVH